MKKDCKLLPHIKETVYGLNRNAAQISGWEIQQFNIPNEWKFSKGENIKIAVIDTGCDLYHDDIKDNLLVGKNFIDENKDPIDDNGHGTHVSGTIAASDNKVGVVGVAPLSKIIPIKALDGSGSGNNKIISKAIVWAADQGANFIAMSLGSENDSLDLKKAIDYANKLKCIVFCAAGNSGKHRDIMYPARYDTTIAIGSINSNLQRSKFTCAGDSLDFLSPGENIFGCVPNNQYAIMSGTSMANPFAVGCAVLLASYAQKIKYKLVDKNQYIDIFKQNTSSLLESQYSKKKKYEGYGIINPSCRIITKL